jgi:hypothetical protein
VARVTMELEVPMKVEEGECCSGRPPTHSLASFASLAYTSLGGRDGDTNWQALDGVGRSITQ